MRRLPLLPLVTVALLLEGCASSLCERRDDFLRNRCTGTNVTYTGDPMCEANVAACSDVQTAQFAGYVACLERQTVCSLEALGRCAEQWPGGVNLVCGQPR